MPVFGDDVSFFLLLETGVLELVDFELFLGEMGFDFFRFLGEFFETLVLGFLKFESGFFD